MKAPTSILSLLLLGVALLLEYSDLSAQITIGQFTGSPSTTLYGQSFTATDLGPNGSGVAPSPGNLLTLNSFTFAFGTSGGRDAVISLSIYDSQAAATNQSPALFTSTSFTDSAGNDPNFAYPSRTYVFTSNITLTAGSLYYAGLSIGGNIPSSTTNLYLSGEFYQLGVGAPGPTGPDDPGGNPGNPGPTDPGSGGGSIGQPGPTGPSLALGGSEFSALPDSAPVTYSGGTGDAVFYASLSTASIPEPSAYAALTGAVALGLAAWRHRWRR